MPRSDYIDISMPIREGMHLWPGDPELEIEQVASMAKGHGCNLTRISCCVHIGTHVDAPLHFVDGGSTVDELPLRALIGPARVVAVESAGLIEPADVDALRVRSGERVLLKTRNSLRLSEPRFLDDFAAFSDEGARRMAEAGPALVGIDYLSVQSFRAVKPQVHQALLGAGVVVVEGLSLAAVEPGAYELVCLPLLIEGCEGAPARAVLRRI